MSLWLCYKQKETPTCRYTVFCPVSLLVYVGRWEADFQAHTKTFSINEEECQMGCCSMTVKSVR
jgi:hypothetical protein